MDALEELHNELYRAQRTESVAVLMGSIGKARVLLARYRESLPIDFKQATDQGGWQARAVRAGWNECARQMFSLADQTADETADKTGDFERGRRFEAKGIARAINGFGPEHCEGLSEWFAPKHPSEESVPETVLTEEDMQTLADTHGFTGDFEEMAREVEALVLSKLGGKSYWVPAPLPAAPTLLGVADGDAA